MIRVKAEVQLIHGKEEPVYDNNKCMIQLINAKSVICYYDDNDFIEIDTPDGILSSFDLIPRDVTVSLIDSGLVSGFIDFTKAGIAFRKQV